MEDDFAKLSEADRAKLEALRQERERDGQSAFDRFAESDPATYLRILEAIDRRAVRDAIEDVLIDRGLTNAEFRKIAAAARPKH